MLFKIDLFEEKIVGKILRDHIKCELSQTYIFNQNFKSLDL